VRDSKIMRMTGTSEADFQVIYARELKEIERRRAHYLGARKPVPIQGRIAIVVDDGLATGNTMRAALEAARMRSPAMLVMAVPVAPKSAIAELRAEADEVFCLKVPEPFSAVGYFYENFEQTEDEEVIALLARHGEKPLPEHSGRSMPDPAP
jgi:putative phosphoribosyl transferase